MREDLDAPTNRAGVIRGCFFCLLLHSLATVSPAPGQTYYVSSSGDDAKDGR